MTETETPADASVVRAVLREHGHPISDRGRLSAEHHRLYAELTGGTGPGPGEDYDEGISAADFGPELEPDEMPSGDGGDAPAPVVPERWPRRLKRSRPPLRERIAKATSGPGRGRKGGQGPGRQRPKVKHKRVSLEDFTASLWNVAARIAMQVDVPIGRCLVFQAPIAGLVLEDVIRDTAVDPVFQVAARAQEKGKMVAALIGPPAIVGAIRMAQGLPEPQRTARLAVLMPMLRESLALSVRIAGSKAEQIMAREAELGPIYETVDRQMAAIFAEVPFPADQAAATEDAMAAAASAFTG